MSASVWQSIDEQPMTSNSWISFDELKYRSLHPWITIKSDGVYCMYCSGYRRSIKSKSPVFVTQPFTGHRYDKLIRHEISKAHTHAAEDFRVAESRKASQRTVDVANKIPEVTEDGEALLNVLFK